MTGGGGGGVRRWGGVRESRQEIFVFGRAKQKKTNGNKKNALIQVVRKSIRQQRFQGSRS